MADDLAGLGLNLLNQSKWAEAAPVLRECLAIREKATPDEWPAFEAMSRLGEALLGQRKFADSEPMIVKGYEGMKARENSMQPPDRPRLLTAAERVLRLYEQWGKLEKTAEWKTRLSLDDLPRDVFAPR